MIEIRYLKKQKTTAERFVTCTRTNNSGRMGRLTVLIGHLYIDDGKTTVVILNKTNAGPRPGGVQPTNGRRTLVRGSYLAPPCYP